MEATPCGQPAPQGDYQIQSKTQRRPFRPNNRLRNLPVNDVQLKPFRLNDFLKKVETLIGPAV